MDRGPDAESTDSAWKSAYKIGGAAALLALLIGLLDIAISIVGEDTGPSTLTAIDWFSLFRGNWFLSLRALGLFNMITVPLMIPLYFALYGAQRRVNAVYAGLALVLAAVGVAVYVANNAAIPMFLLSGKYAAATTDAQRTLLASAGEAILARGEDFTPGAFMGFLLPEIASLTISLVILRGRVFGRAAAYTGIVGSVFLVLFTLSATFFPASFDVAMLAAMVGGLSSMAWYVLIALGLFRLGQGIALEEANLKGSRRSAQRPQQPAS